MIWFLFLPLDNIVQYSTESSPNRLKELQTFTESALNRDNEDATENTLTTTSTEQSNQLGTKIRNWKSASPKLFYDTLSSCCKYIFLYFGSWNWSQVESK